MLVNQVTTFTKNGIQDWLIQRVTATIIISYFIFLTYYLYTSAPMTYEVWRALFKNVFMQWYTIAAFTSIVIHAWIGMWTITTDYIHNLVLRLSSQLITMLILFFYLAWVLEILWSI